MSDDEHFIEGKVLAVVQTPEPPLEKRFQATVKASTDHKLTQIENIIIGAPSVTKALVIDVLSIYLLKRTNRSEVRNIFKAYILGQKPVVRCLRANQWKAEFTDLADHFIETYNITFIEL